MENSIVLISSFVKNSHYYLKKKYIYIIIIYVYIKHPLYNEKPLK